MNWNRGYRLVLNDKKVQPDDYAQVPITNLMT